MRNGSTCYHGAIICSQLSDLASAVRITAANGRSKHVKRPIYMLTSNVVSAYFERSKHLLRT